MKIKIRKITKDLIHQIPNKIIILKKWEIPGIFFKIIGDKFGIFGKTIIRITIKNQKLSIQCTLIHRSKFKIFILIIGSK